MMNGGLLQAGTDIRAVRLGFRHLPLTDRGSKNLHPPPAGPLGETVPATASRLDMRFDFIVLQPSECNIAECSGQSLERAYHMVMNLSGTMQARTESEDFTNPPDRVGFTLKDRNVLWRMGSPPP